MEFKQLKLKDYLKNQLSAIHFDQLTTVQEEVIPRALQGESLIVQSQTGSGKTHAFLIPILQALDFDKKQVQAVITAPSRELANQIYDFATELLGDNPEELRVVRYVGGTDKERQLEKLENQQPQLVIGTPGRIFDLMQENALWVQTAEIFVVDEADMTFDLGFLNLVDDIASRMPQDLQMMVFSATIPQQVSVFLNKYMTAPKEIKLSTQQVLSDHVKNYLIDVKGQDRQEMVYRLLTLGQPYLALVFCNTRDEADQVSLFLKEKGLKIATLHGGIVPRERARIMRQIKNLDYQFVVASDLAARGIDIPGISHVINMGIPKELEFFVHRVGRTARNQLAGTAYTLMTSEDEDMIDALEDRGIEFTQMRWQDGDLVEADLRHRRKKRLDRSLKNQDPHVQALINRNKKAKVKPGYKQKLKQEIRDYKKSQSKRNFRLKNKNNRSSKGH